ncbi:MAG: hypothetical protein JNK82_40895 [Myxococcaceae bacterium]|nr:hypothetical protein [Myxococcaceae bacterium]
MVGLVLLALTAACPDGDDACVLAERPAAVADRAALERALSEPEFSRVRNRNSNVIAQLWEQFFAWLKRVFQTREAATFAKAAPFGVLTLAFSVALFALLRFVRLRNVRGAGSPAAVAAEPERLDLKPAPEHLANARRLVGSDPRAAIREALLALLSSLERRNLARPNRVKTNRELCAELPGRGADAGLVREVSAQLGWYDRVFYSMGAVGADEARGFIVAIERLV